MVNVNIKLLTTTSFFAILTRHPSQKNVVRTPLEDFKMHVSTTVFAAVQMHQRSMAEYTGYVISKELF